jgi:hypothetical protein
LLVLALSVAALAATGTMGGSVAIEDLKLPEVEGGPKLGDYVTLKADGTIDMGAMTPQQIAEGIKKFNVDNYNYYIDNNIPIDGVEKPDIEPPLDPTPGSKLEDIIIQTKGDLAYNLSHGGKSFVNTKFEILLADVYELFLPLGYCIMFVCWIIGMCKCGATLNFDLGAKDGIIWSGLSLLLGLFLMEASMEIMESLSAMCWEYCKSLDKMTYLTATSGQIMDNASDSWIGKIGNNLMSWVIEAVLILNVAYMGLLQCFSPIFIGFAAGGDGTRRFATSFFKEYIKVCLIPLVVAVYVGLCFQLFESVNVGWFLCVVHGISVFSIGKKLDKIIT